MKKCFSSSGFSFVELVVSISILAILSSIAFVSFGQYLKSSRDAQRITDISTLKLTLKTHRQKYGSIPLPASTFSIQTGSVLLATQWILNENVGIAGLSSTPKDPVTLKGYTYSVSTNRKEFQVAATLESEKKLRAKVDGEYRVVAKNILPSLVLAYSGVSALDVSLPANQSRFIFDTSEHTLPYDFAEYPLPKYDSTQTLASLLVLYGYTIQESSLYNSCTEIYNAGRSVGTGAYSVINSSGALATTNCCTANGKLASCGTAADAPVADAYAANVVSLLHLDGNFIDTKSKTWAANGWTATTTAQKRFGDNSLFLDGTDDAITTSDSDDFFFWAAPTFSVDFWFYPTATQPDYATFYAQELNTNNLFVLDYGALGKLRMVSTTAGAVTGEVYCSVAPTLALNTWHHIYYWANAGTPYIGANGTLCSLTGSPATFWGLANIASSAVIGYRPTQSGRYVKGYIDEMRITKGVARWTSNYSLPTGPSY